MHAAQCRRLTPPCQRAGYVTSMATGASKYLLWRCTELGADLTGLNLANPRKISPTVISHDLGLVDLGIRFEAAGEWPVQTLGVIRGSPRTCMRLTGDRRSSFRATPASCPGRPMSNPARKRGSSPGAPHSRANRSAPDSRTEHQQVEYRGRGRATSPPWRLRCPVCIMRGFSTPPRREHLISIPIT